MASDWDACVVGLGVIGLPFAAVLADAGHRVLGVDVDAKRVTRCRDAAAPYGEDDVDALIRQQRDAGRLAFADKVEPARNYLLCVPTPLQAKAKRADLGAVRSAAASVAAVARSGDLVVVESTVPPGTLEREVAPIFAAAGADGVLLAHAPERLLPGDVLKEILHNDRLIGGLSPEATKAAAALYRSFAKGDVVETTATTAEMVKIFENTYRDVNVALANELALLARNAGVDDEEAFALANRHPRVAILSPGIGVGGHCLPVDPWFLHEIDPESAVLLATARRINEAVPDRVAEAIQRWFAASGCQHLLLVGKSYKADVWDPRESPALEIGQHLRAAGVAVDHWDPLEPDAEEPARHDSQTAVVLLVGHKKAHGWMQAVQVGKKADATRGTIVDA